MRFYKPQESEQPTQPAKQTLSREENNQICQEVHAEISAGGTGEIAMDAHKLDEETRVFVRASVAVVQIAEIWETAVNGVLSDDKVNEIFNLLTNLDDQTTALTILTLSDFSSIYLSGKK